MSEPEIPRLFRTIRFDAYPRIIFSYTTDHHTAEILVSQSFTQKTRVITTECQGGLVIRPYHSSQLPKIIKGIQ